MLFDDTIGVAPGESHGGHFPLTFRQATGFSGGHGKNGKSLKAPWGALWRGLEERPTPEDFGRKGKASNSPPPAARRTAGGAVEARVAERSAGQIETYSSLLALRSSAEIDRVARLRSSFSRKPLISLIARRMSSTS